MRQDNIGDFVTLKDELEGVPRLQGKQFEVTANSSCQFCAFQGLGHVVCPRIACKREERDDGHNVNYVEVKES